MTPPVPPNPPAPAAPRSITGQDLNIRIAHGDPAYPKELWGKTLGEALRFYSIMREDFMRRNQPGGGQPPLQGDPGAPPAPPAPAPRPAYVPPAPATPPAAGAPTFDEASLQRMIDGAVSRAFASSPMAVNVADQTHDRMKREYADWMHYDAEILQTLEGASAEQLANPETWRTAYFFIKGKKLSENGGQPPAPTYQPDPHQPPIVFGSNNGQPIVSRPPAPPTSENPTWFTEGPSAPPAANNGGMDPRNDPRVQAMARRHGIPVDEYVQWLGGNVPPMTRPAGA